ncbi:MAG: PorT family protein [Flavipsychrobacter sp.]|nr:PorT family protein [Flavipsychrobacter sp.]
MAKNRHFAALVAGTLIACGLCVTSSAQSSYYEEDPRTFYAGPVFGGNFTQVDGDNYAGYSKPGFNVGGVLYMHMAPKVAASMEILFSQKGAVSNIVKNAGLTGLIIQKYRLNLNYAEVPVMLQFFDKRKSHAGFGLSVSRLITMNERADVEPKSVSVPDFERDFPVNKMDYNFLVGANLHCWKGIFFNLRFQYSLTPMRKNIDPRFGRTEQFNNMFAVRVIYLFGYNSLR